MEDKQATEAKGSSVDAGASAAASAQPPAEQGAGAGNDEGDDSDGELPEGWEKCFDERFHLPYWFHAESGESVWEKPRS